MEWKKDDVSVILVDKGIHEMVRKDELKQVSSHTLETRLSVIVRVSETIKDNLFKIRLFHYTPSGEQSIVEYTATCDLQRAKYNALEMYKDLLSEELTRINILIQEHVA